MPTYSVETNGGAGLGSSFSTLLAVEVTAELLSFCPFCFCPLRVSASTEALSKVAIAVLSASDFALAFSL